MTGFRNGFVLIPYYNAPVCHLCFIILCVARTPIVFCVHSILVYMSFLSCILYFFLCHYNKGFSLLTFSSHLCVCSVLAYRNEPITVILYLVWLSRYTHLVILIGASLSEPHTSVTAFAEVVCMYVCLSLRPYTVNFK